MHRRAPTPMPGTRNRIRGSQNAAVPLARATNPPSRSRSPSASARSPGRIVNTSAVLANRTPPRSPRTTSASADRRRPITPTMPTIMRAGRYAPARRFVMRPATVGTTSRNSGRNPSSWNYRRMGRPTSGGSSSGSRSSGSRSGTRRRVRPSSSSRPRRRASRTLASASTAETAEAAPAVAASASSHGTLAGGRSSRRRVRSKSRVSFLLPDPASISSIKLITENEKCLKKIFSNLNWNELLVVRQVCTKWLEVVSSDPLLKESSGVITIRKDFGPLQIFNESSVIWSQFRIYSPITIDMTQSIQAEFWSKHGGSITFLELKSPANTLSGLVEVLNRCPNLVHFMVIWTPEMYPFNSELIKKYYGITIRNGTFSKMSSLVIEKSSYVTDTALLSILKWCGSSLQSLALTCPTDDSDENLVRLKPRWTIEPIDNFTNRFSYAKNLKFLDFSGSNLTSPDLIRLGDMEKLVHLTGIKLSRCKVTDESTLHFLLKKGTKLEQLYLDYTLTTDDVFDFKENKDLNLKKLRLLDISGTQNLTSINFLPELLNLEDLYCGDTTWLNYTMLKKPIEVHSGFKKMRRVNFSYAEKSVLKTMDVHQRNNWMLGFCLILKKLTEINLSHWVTFGTDDNFKQLCFSIPNLKKLRVRGWSNLTDEGVIGFSYEELVDMEDSEKDIWANTRTRMQQQSLARLQGLQLIDFGGCFKLTDISIQFGILYLPNLRALSLDGSQVTDVGIHVLIAKSKTLDKLSILACDQVTPKGKKINRLDGRSVQFTPIRTN